MNISANPKSTGPAPASPWLKSTEWLASQLGKPDVAVVDGSYYLSTQKRDAAAEYRSAHIPGAVFFDINAIADTSTDLPHMLPGPDQFAQRRKFLFAQRSLELQVELDPFPLQRVRQQMLRVQPRTFDIPLLKVSGRRLQDFENGHESKM